MMLKFLTKRSCQLAAVPGRSCERYPAFHHYHLRLHLDLTSLDASAPQYPILNPLFTQRIAPHITYSNTSFTSLLSLLRPSPSPSTSLVES